MPHWHGELCFGLHGQHGERGICSRPRVCQGAAGRHMSSQVWLSGVSDLLYLTYQVSWYGPLLSHTTSLAIKPGLSVCNSLSSHILFLSINVILTCPYCLKLGTYTLKHQNNQIYRIIIHICRNMGIVYVIVITDVDIWLWSFKWGPIMLMYPVEYLSHNISDYSLSGQ